MEELRKQVRRAHRRLGLQRFLGTLCWCWSVTLLAALVLIAVDKWYPLGVEVWAWGVGALGLGLLAAIAWIVATRRKPLDAAIEIDRRFALKERVSSTLAMPPDDRESEAGQALVADALRRVERIDVATKFAVRPPRQILLPLLPGVLAVLAAVLIPAAVIDSQAGAAPDSPAAKRQVKRSTEELRRKLAERREQAKKAGLKDAEQLFKRLEEGSREMTAGKTDRKKALVELNDYARQLERRRKQLGGAEEIKKQLDQLKNINRGPADKFAKAVGRGDFKQAADELKKLIDQLADSKLSEKQKAALAKQLKAMKQKLEDLAAARAAAQDDLRSRIEQLRQAGQLPEAGKLEEQLAKLLQQGPQMKQLDDLAGQLGQCAKCLRDGQLEDAGDALRQLQAGIGNLQDQLDELKLLDDVMGQLDQAKDCMNCQNCGGLGCGQCEGEGGFGLGPGRGRGARPEAETDTSFYDTQVKQKLGRGTADVVDLVDGPNVKGNVEAEIQQQFESVRRGSTDPLTGRRIPRKHQQHAREYFDRFREGE